MRFLLEGCLEIGLGAMISVLMVQKETFYDFWEVICILTAYISLFVLAVVPCYFMMIQRQYLKVVSVKGVEKKASEHHEFFEAYRSNTSSLMYPIFFLLRRYVMIIILTTMPGFKYA